MSKLTHFGSSALEQDQITHEDRTNHYAQCSLNRI
jgi:hypothetical protein